MPKNPDIKKVLVIGSGPIVIGQAAEFDYAGTQACRALRDDGIEIVLVDPEGRIAAVPRSSSARRLADHATGFGADPASDLARDAATNPAPGLDPSTDPASMFHVKQSTQCSATKEQMFHVKHSEPVPAMPGASGASPRAEISVGAGCCPPAGAQQGAPTQSPDNATPAAPVAAVAPAMPAAPAATAASAAKGVR